MFTSQYYLKLKGKHCRTPIAAMGYKPLWAKLLYASLEGQDMISSF